MVKQRYPKDISLGTVCYVQAVFAYAVHYLELHIYSISLINLVHKPAR